MKLCQNEEVLYRLGQKCLCGQAQVIRALDNRLLCWAFITVLAFLYGCFFGNIFFFFDMLCCGCFMIWAGRKRLYAGKIEAVIELQEETTISGEVLSKQEEKAKSDGFFTFIGWLSALFLGLLFIVCFFQEEGVADYHTLYGKMPLLCAISLLFIKEGAYQIGYRGQENPDSLIVSGYRYSQLPTVCTLAACLLSNLGQEEVFPYILLTTYLFDMILLCPVFKRSILP